MPVARPAQATQIPEADTPVPMHVIDAEGRIERVSDRWLECLGYERHEVVGRPRSTS